MKKRGRKKFFFPSPNNFKQPGRVCNLFARAESFNKGDWASLPLRRWSDKHRRINIEKQRELVVKKETVCFPVLYRLNNNYWTRRYDMNLTASNWIGIAQALLLFATFLVIFFQLLSLRRQTTGLSQSINFQNISSLLSRHADIHRFLIERPHLSKHFGYHKEKESEDKILNDHYVMYMVDSFEIIFVLRKQGLVPDYIWEKSLDNFKHIVGQDQRFELFWRMPNETLRSKFDPDLVTFMSENIMVTGRVN